MNTFKLPVKQSEHLTVTRQWCV